MLRSSYGSGTLFKRGQIWYVAYWLDGRQVQKSSHSTNIQDAKRIGRTSARAASRSGVALDQYSRREADLHNQVRWTP
jgi:hypothetical protein